MAVGVFLELKCIIKTNIHNKTKLALHKLLYFQFKSGLKQLHKSKDFSVKGGCNKHLKEELTWATDTHVHT